VHGDPLRRPDRADELLLPILRCCADDLDRIAVRRDPDDPPLVSLEDGDDLRQLFGFCEALLRDDDCEAGRELAAAPRVTGGLAAERCRQLPDERLRPVQQHPPPRLRRAELREALLDPQRRLRPDPRDTVETSLHSRLAKLCQRPDPERMAELAHPLRRQAEQSGDADELGERLRLELVQLGDPPGRDELAETRLDSGPDPREVAHAALAHELGHVGRC
jgi:hypothetical protein